MVSSTTPNDAQAAPGRQPSGDALVVVIADKTGTGGNLLPLGQREKLVQDGQHGLLHLVDAR